MPQALTIAGRSIGPGRPPFVIAELSGNHNGDIGRAKQLMRAAKDAGADAIKIQTYTADTITIDHDGPEFRITGGLWHNRSLHDLYREAHTPWEWHAELFELGRELGVPVFSSPFDETAVDFLEELGAPAYKVASFELIDLPLIRKMASTGKPMIMSTGLGSLGEIAEAVEAARGAGCKELAVLHCVSAYPSPVEEANVRTMVHLAEAFDVVVGLSDHSPGAAVPAAAVALGASVVEKHMTLARADGGPDSAFSLEPNEFREMAETCRLVQRAIGQVSYETTESEKGNLIFRRSLYVVADVAAGDEFTAANVRSIRPGKGLPPKHMPQVLGRVARRAIKRGTALSWTDVD